MRGSPLVPTFLFLSSPAFFFFFIIPSMAATEISHNAVKKDSLFTDVAPTEIIKFLSYNRNNNVFRSFRFLYFRGKIMKKISSVWEKKIHIL